MQARQPKGLMRLDTITVDEARRLAEMLALEEASLSSEGNGNIHCVGRGHPHKKQDNTPSMSIYAKEKNGRSDTCVGACRCHSHCGKTEPFSSYIARVGPPSAQTDFWTDAKIQSVITGLKSKEPFSLGWIDWKKARGFQVEGVTADQVLHKEAGRLTGDHGYAPGRLSYIERFVESREDARADHTSPSAVEKLCHARGWNPSTVEELMDEGLLGVRWSTVYKDDVEMSFAYRGLYMNDNSLPARVIKYKHLANKDKKGGFGFKYTGTETPVIGDYTAPHTSLQEAKTILFEEGEPDACTWRHMFSDHGIVCLGNKNQYRAIPTLLPRLRIAGKEIIYAIDRDFDKAGNLLALGDQMKEHIEILEAIRREKPKSIKVWMCPILPGKEAKESKDINDFYKVSKDKEKFLAVGMELSMDVREPLSKSYANVVKRISDRKAYHPDRGR